jgi:predicted kinase
MPEAVILIGLQGAGKTTYYNQNFAQTHIHISKDVQKNPARENALFSDCLRNGQSVVVDDTNLSRASRSGFVVAAKAAGYRVIACYFDVSVRTAIGRNNHRSDKKPVPVPALLRFAKLLEPPACEEGFDEVRIIGAERYSPE